jgi:hypothetical protein
MKGGTMDGIEAFLDGSGRVARWPRKKGDKFLVLRYLQGKFEIDAKYSEREVNGILMKWHAFNDHALLRRELFNAFLLDRTPDCREYWVNAGDYGTHHEAEESLTGDVKPLQAPGETAHR